MTHANDYEMAARDIFVSSDSWYHCLSINFYGFLWN